MSEHTRNCPSCKNIFEYKNGCCGCYTCPKCGYVYNCAGPIINMSYYPVYKHLFTADERLEILNRCKYSAENVKLNEDDLGRIINMFEYSNIEPAKIGNIIKYICVCVEERNKNSV